METKIIWFVYLTALYYIGHLLAEFVPQDNYLLNCGSTINTTVDNRVFIGDSAEPGSVFLHSHGNSISLRNPSSNSSPLYSTVRIFTSSSSYVFGIEKLGTHLVRLHFSPFSSPQFDFKKSNFNVLADGVSLLSNFGAKDIGVTVVKEFIIEVDIAELEISFVPSQEQNFFAFVSAIEVFSAPKNFFVDGVSTSLIVPNKGVKGFNHNISTIVLETVHRINVGGQILTPFNDTLWRTWIPDEDFLVLKSAAKIATASHPPNYQQGGASEEIAPDNVYMTAQHMNRDNVTTVYNFNITWDFPVGLGDTLHFVRLHFCDIVSLALNQLYFNVYINDVMAYKDLDLSSLTFHALASPYYLDFVVDNGHTGMIRISVGPSDLSSSLKKDAILNGVEIMSIKNFVALESTGPYKRSIWILIGSVIGGFVVLCFVLLAGVVVLRRRRRRGKPRRVGSTDTGWTPLHTYRCSSIGTMSEGTALTSPGPNGYHGWKIPYADIALATNNFDQTLMIGSGGFGMVYKAILKDNTKVAVKRGIPGSRQGLPEFHTEIAVLSKIRHLHLVSLVGYCEEQSEMILVYEYMEKGTLKSHLYGPKLSPLSWKQRLEICIGAARGIHYLHTGSAQGIIHRDIKSTNILLDENYIAKVADFGLSRSGPCLNETHVSTGVKGSFGYLDPEYFRRRQLTDKSDVYSFGVVLFEVLCARPAIEPALEPEQVNLGEWALEWQKKGLLEQIIDTHLRRQVRPSSLKKFGETAEKCLANYAIDRPTMGDVLWNLEHALQLQENGAPLSPAPDIVTTMEPQSAGDVLQVPAENIRMERVTAEGSSNISTSRIFSQLIDNDGR